MKAIALKSGPTYGSPHQDAANALPRVILGEWQRLWLALAGLSVLVVTVVDAILLQRKLEIFTGGFLSVDHLKGPVDIVLFILTSLIADLGVIAPLVALSLWVFSRMGLNARPSILAVLAVAIVPIMATDFVSYRIHTYLGDAFDLVLAFELAGGSPVEFFAMTMPHLVAPLMLLALNGVLIVLLIWLFKRYVPGWVPLPKAPSAKRLALDIALVFSVAVVVTCVAQVASEPLSHALRRKPSGELLGLVGEGLSDLDRDGYGIVRRPLDPDPLNARIFPYALEVAGNGIDENGVAGDLPADTAPYTEASSQVSQWTRRPNVIFFLLESVRPDLIGARYQGKPIMPVMDRLAGQGISASLAFSHNGFTAPSRHQLFSGSLANIGDGTSLIDDFKANGYEVAYFSAQDVSFGGPSFDVGFSRAHVAYDARVNPEKRFTMFATPASIGLPHQFMVEKVSEFFEKHDGDRPLFLYVNFQDTHFPYHHHHIRNLISDTALPRAEISPGNKTALWATYVNTAANVDMAIGEILEVAKRSLGDDAPGIIVTSDHGESLYDDGFLGHGIALNDVQMRVPLLVVNLPLTIRQPIGLAQLRDAIRKGLEHEPDAAVSPVLKEDPAARVFQYLGNLHRPRQIGLRGSAGIIIYDFRTGRVRLPNDSWREADRLSGIDAERFRTLVHLWERMVQSANAAKAGDA